MPRALTLAWMLLAPAAFADPLKVALPKGHTKVLSLHQRIRAIDVEDPKVVSIKKLPDGIAIYGRDQGTTEAVIRTAEGETSLRIYVAADTHAMPR